jgi:glycosyltransferase involved in cell wall biosynthesis
VKLLLELRPALAGHAGIPQETRLLFAGLQGLPGLQVDGLLQGSNQRLPSGAEAGEPADDEAQCRSAAVALALKEGGDPLRWRRVLRMRGAALASATASALGREPALTHFLPAGQEAFLWHALFDKTLPDEDRARVCKARYRVARQPWTAAHAGGVLTGRMGHALYPRLDTRGYHVFVAETPYPGRVSPGTRLVVRYHDAIPMRMTHTVRKLAYDRDAHAFALQRNVRDGAWFACVSEATRQDLLAEHPQLGERAVTVSNMVSPQYFAEDSPAAAVPDILRRHAHAGLRPAAVTAPAAYLLMVSTLEPRKNHATLLRAWQGLRQQGQPGLQLVLVGALGWHHDELLRQLRPWVEQGQVHVLDAVPATALRCLYRHALATVCPSLGEGFGYSGVEAMASGGIVVASNLPVHREVYGDAALYFEATDADELARVLGRLMDAKAAEQRQRLARRGADVAARYAPQQLQPQWARLLERVVAASAG